jgi:hypothetical protein
MPHSDDRLRALFASDAPPAHDPAFAAAVMGKLARRRFRDELLHLSATTALGGLALWALWPQLAPAVTALSQAFAPALGVIALSASAWFVAAGRPARPRPVS